MFNRECAEHLKAYLDSRNELSSVFVNATFNSALHSQRVNEKYQTYSEQLGFCVHPHLLRHTFAAHLAQKGMPLIGIQNLLGHENPKTTHLFKTLRSCSKRAIRTVDVNESMSMSRSNGESSENPILL